MNQLEVSLYDNSVRVKYTDKGLTEVSFQKKKSSKEIPNDPMAKKINKALVSYLSGKTKVLDLPIDWKNIEGTDFQKKVWKRMLKIPFGKVKTYGEIAVEVGSPNAFRAVGSACGKNRVLLVIPCHRVVSAQGIGGFSGGGLPVKRKLHELEKIDI